LKTRFLPATATLLFSIPLFAQEIKLTSLVSGISSPTGIENAADGTGRLFFLQQNGIVRIFQNGALATQPFLDIRSKTTTDSERGLLGLAFPPNFATKRRFYVNYTNLSGNTVIAQYKLSANDNQADATSEVILLTITQPFANHNGGQIRFGPDGYLYIGMGDGGSGGDPSGNGQNRNALLGKMLRIDVETQPGTIVIPPTNPFVNVAGTRPEIWAVGMRNPWRFNFDRATGDLWIADVGQDAYEEVDFQPASSKGGENYGWNTMEGLHCYKAGCSTTGLTLPVAEYPHGPECSITGGFVYRGANSPGLRGTYLYADYCSGKIWGLERQGTGWANRTLMTASGFAITTFGQDEAGELYLANANNGTIYRIDGSAAPRINTSGIVNAASFATGATAGSLETVFVSGVLANPGSVSATNIPLPLALNQVSITVNGTPAPILAIANANGREQVNFQMPFEIAGQSTASVIVSLNNIASPVANVTVAELQPAIYSSDGTQAVVVHNADYSLVTPAKPLVAGEYAFVYASGLGRVANQPATGAGAPKVAPFATTQSNVTARLGGISADVQFAGLAPGFVGVYQVNFRVPSGVPSGQQDLVLSIGGINSPTLKAPVQ
jgi:uncharacterized protein (TIGR03437 family)